MKNFSSVTSLLETGMTPENMMEQLFQGYDLHIMDTRSTAYRCDCSKERVYRAVMSIGRKDIEEMIADQKPIEVNCHFCRKNYCFDVEELKSMLN